MNTSIKRRQTLLVNWLAKTLNCKPITIAQTGSYYTEFNTQYTGKSVIRISDHLSSDRTYIHIILSPLNTIVIVNYKNFVWSGSFTEAKTIIYTLIMSKAMTELANPVPSGTIPVETVKKVIPIKATPVNIITKAEYTALSLVQKNKLKQLIGCTVADGWKKIKSKITREKYEEAKITVGTTTVCNPTKSITKSQLLRLSNEVQKEVIIWINSTSSKKYSTISELPVETIQISSNQYKRLEPYLI